MGGGIPPYARASEQNPAAPAIFCALYALFAHPAHKMHAQRLLFGDPSLPPSATQTSAPQHPTLS